MQILEHVPLAPLTTLKVGGPARYFAEARTAADARQLLDWAGSRQVPLFVLGGGSNLVVADAGFSGLILRVAITGIEQRAEEGKTVFEAGAGEDWDALVERAVQANCAGIECLSGIPGTVGGTPVQNVGAYGQEVSETISEVLALDMRDGQMRTLCNPGCGFAYRSSVFNTTERGRYLILKVTYALEPGGAPKIHYRDLKEYFKSPGNAAELPKLAEVRKAVRAIRLSKAMLIVEGDEDARSAGSFFKNPVLDPSAYQEMVKTAESRGLRLPSYPAPGQAYKVPAAWLVENAGFYKGYRKGRVGISRKHALAIVNRGGATAAEVIALKEEIQARVRDVFGVELTAEPVMVGF
jgi:UDP-N-acetylmuramate dehydrogenase